MLLAVSRAVRHLVQPGCRPALAAAMPCAPQAAQGTQRWLAMVLVAMVALPGIRGALAQETVPWLSGPAFERALAEETTIAWSGVPLGDALANLARQHRVAVLLDRRVDPNRLLTLEGTLPLRDVFPNAARNVQLEPRAPLSRLAPSLGVSYFGPVVYVGPENAARNLRTVAEHRREEVRQAPSSQRSRLLRSSRIEWGEAAQPRDLLSQLAEEAGVQIENLGDVPHDLWRAGSLPSLPWCDRLTLILAQFDLTFTLAPSGNQVRLRPIAEDDVAIQRSYPGGADAAAMAERFRAKLPDAEIGTQGNQVLIRGRVEDHEVASGKAPTPSLPPGQRPQGVDHYTLRINQVPLRTVLDYLKRNLKLELEIDDAALQAAELSLEHRVSFNVEQVSLDELLEAAVQGAGLTIQRDGQKVKIVPAR